MSFVLRVRAPSGTFRLQISRDATLQVIAEMVSKEMSVPSSAISLFLDETGKSQVENAHVKIFENGQMIFAKINGVVEEDKGLPELDEVDIILARRSGLVERKQDPQLCRHGPKGMCSHCDPLEPFDERIMIDRHINFLSFQAYLRKTNSAPLNAHRLIVKPCAKHPPWPLAICSSCQPQPMTLNKQKFRHVDAVAFESSAIMNTFLDSWRRTGVQRYGLLYGTYQPYDVVPLGVKAVVSAIYEPPQTGTTSSIDIVEDPDAAKVDRVAKLLGLKKVGWIFTDLEPLATQASKVVCSRHKESYFLKANEVILAAHFQNQNPSRCDLSDTGRYGSKFVTVVVSGDRENNVVPEAYQMSQQAMDLEFDNVFEHSPDPRVARLAVGDDTRFLPEILYKTKSEFGADVTRRADPTCLLDYFVISLSCTYSVDDAPLLHREHFPIENRLDASQSFAALASYMKKMSDLPPLQMLSNFHFLIFLGLKTGVEGLLEHENGLPLLCRAVRDRNGALAAEGCRTHFWSEVVAKSLSAADRGSDRGKTASGTAASSSNWVCSICTFINKPPNPSCEMCGGPKK